MICKFDLEKAYDYVNWNFLDYILDRMGFGSKWINWISFCLHSSLFSLLINGSPAGFLGGSEGFEIGEPSLPISIHNGI